MICFRHYEPGDEAQIVEAWNSALSADPITRKRFRNLVLLDGNFDPQGLRLAVAEGRVVGLVYAVRRLMPMAGTELDPTTGWIPFFFVVPEYQGQGVATKLMGEACAFLRDAGREIVFFASYAPNYVLPGIDPHVYPAGLAFLQAMGFEVYSSPVAMDRSLVNFSVPEEIRLLQAKRVQEGYSFELATDSDLVELIQFANQRFNPDWGRAIREGVLQGLPLNRILVVRDQGELVGFSMYGAYEGIPERFGPFGVDSNQRGKGLGKILLNLCLHAMRSEGVHGAWFLWTGETSAAGHLYKSTGFTVTRQFHVMRRLIK